MRAEWSAFAATAGQTDPAATLTIAAAVVFVLLSGLAVAVRWSVQDIKVPSAAASVFAG